MTRMSPVYGVLSGGHGVQVPGIDFLDIMLRQRRLQDRLEATRARMTEAEDRAAIDPFFPLHDEIAEVARELRQIDREADVILAELAEHV